LPWFVRGGVYIFLLYINNQFSSIYSRDCPFSNVYAYWLCQKSVGYNMRIYFWVLCFIPLVFVYVVLLVPVV
jgi:hypothetical protein